MVVSPASFFMASSGGGFDPELIGNSVWLDGSADFLNKSFSGSASATEGVYSMWVQRTGYGTDDGIFGTYGTIDSATKELMFAFRTSNKLQIYWWQSGVGTVLNFITTRVFRDIGWYHILFSYKTDESDAADRAKLFINGIEETAYDTKTNPSSSYAPPRPFASVAFGIGVTGETGALNSDFLDGYVAQSTFLDGHSIQGGDVAVTDFLDSFTYGTNGSQFSPKSDADIAALATTAGGNSFCLDFASSSDLGNDISSNNNDFTATSMSSTNQSTNTPSLVYPKISNIGTPSGDAAASYTMGLGSNRMVYSGANQAALGLIGTTLIQPDDPKIYWEFYIEGGSVGGASGGRLGNGIAVPHFNGGTGNGFYGAGGESAFFYRGTMYDNGATSVSGFTTAPVGGIQQMAFEPSTGKVWIGVDGTWRNGAGTSGTTLDESNPDDQLTVQDYVFTMGAGRSSDVGIMNFGDNPTMSGNITAGGNTDGSGYGNFKYAVPSGFLAPNSANVEPQTIQGVDGFITTLSTESNIVSAVATARSDWSTAYVDIFKNRSSIETWLYRFGDDSSNEFTAPAGSYPSFSATYQSTSSLSGTDNWLGYSIRIGADYLTAAGSASHSNGSATTVTHNLGTSRYCVLLFERGTTKDVWFHHPDFASGSLLKFVKDEALASSTQITTIGANSFQIGSGAATATYSYLVFADGGIASMGKYVGNGVVNGPYISMPHSSGFFARRSGGARSFWNNNSKSPGYNENENYARFNSLQAEGTSSLKIDMLAGAVKIRDAYADQNTDAETFYWISFGELSGGGENLPPVYGR